MQSRNRNTDPKAVAMRVAPTKRLPSVESSRKTGGG